MKKQHGYRPHHSTQSAVTILSDDLKVALNNSKKVVVAVFVDFEQAFDMVEYGPLLVKLHHIGVREKCFSFSTRTVRTERYL